MNVIVLNNGLDFFETGSYHFFIVACAVLAEKIFEDVCRHRQVAFHKESEVFPYHLSQKRIEYFVS